MNAVKMSGTVAIVALLWNLLGCVAYLSDVTMSPEAIAQMSSVVLLGTEYENIEAGQKSFHANREKPRTR